LHNVFMHFHPMRATCPLYLILLHIKNIWREVRIMKLLITPFSSCPCLSAFSSAPSSMQQVRDRQHGDFWSVTLCSLVKICRRFLQSLLPWVTLRLWGWRQYVPPKRR
jgi:hypothetical protein